MRDPMRDPMRGPTKCEQSLYSRRRPGVLPCRARKDRQALRTGTGATGWPCLWSLWVGVPGLLPLNGRWFEHRWIHQSFYYRFSVMLPPLPSEIKTHNTYLQLEL
jgi:hypothetical protein